MSVEATVTLYYYNGSTWTDISSYVVIPSSISGDWGMRSDSYTDRLASVGEMTFTLRNTSGEFDPDDTDVLTGWAKNTPVKLTVSYDGKTHVRFYGTIEKITFKDNAGADRTATITVVDWMNYAYKYPLTQPSIELNKRGDEAIQTIITSVGKTPLATSYSHGENTFEAVFDTVSTTTKASTEINKIVLSEMGYFYAKKDKDNGETLVFESAIDRNGYTPLRKLPKVAADCGFLLLETGDKLLLETGDKLILDEAEDAHINGTARAIQRAHGEDIINRVTISAYPKEVDTTEAVLYKLESPIKLAAGEVKTVKGSYYNATTKKACNAISSTMVTPVASTDYVMNRRENGTGADLTSSLTVAAAFGTESFEYELQNTSIYPGYVTTLKARGYGVYQNAALEEVLDDTTSQSAYPVSELNIDQQYMRDTAGGVNEGYKILQREKNPRTVPQSASMTANTSSQHMLAFLVIDVGDLVKITDNGKTYYCYVQGVSFSVSSANIIDFKWILKEAPRTLDNGGLTAVSIEQSDDYTSVDFGVVPRILNLEQRTFAFSVYMHSLVGYWYVISLGSWDASSETYGTFIRFSQDGTNVDLNYSVSNVFDTIGAWYSKYALDSIANFINGWHRIVVTTEPRNVLADPVMYCDGVSVTVTETHHPTGSNAAEDDFPLTIGSIRTPGYYEPYGYYPRGNGLLKDVCIYDRILTAAEITADAAGTISTDGLIFRAPCIPTTETTSYYDAALTEAQLIYDNFGGNIGTPKFTPTCREI